MIDYPLARLQGAIDAGATFTLRTIDGHDLEATLRSRGGTEVSVQGPDLSSVASALMKVWFAYAGIESPRDNGEGPFRPHMRAALAELGERHGSAGADGYQTPGCECDYCAAYSSAFAAAAAKVPVPNPSAEPLRRLG